MTFQEPMLLWGLPAAMLPVIIHLLNRLRFRSVSWAAMMFLSAATRSSHRRSRLRHYLLLLLRTLAVLLLALALSRPVTGGWIGDIMGGRPDTVVILLDRSVSMEARDPALQLSKRELALNLFAHATGGAYAGSRVVLIESVLRDAQEVAPGAGLKNLALAAATDTAADIPALFRAAFDHLSRERPGRSEIWVASDFQRSNWRPESPEWGDVMARLAALPGSVQCRVLALQRDYARNTAVAVHDVVRGGNREQAAVLMGLDLRRAGGGAAIPLVVSLDGARSQEELDMGSPELRLHRRFELPAGHPAGGWGRFELPADENARDNAAWFVYPAGMERRGAVISGGGEPARRLCRAVAPDPRRLDSVCPLVAPDAATDLEWDSLALAVWQAPDPGPNGRAALERFVDAGGVAVCFPPGKPDVPGPFGLEWKTIENARPDAAFRPGPWEENEGPLARTDSGQSLPVARLDFRRRQMAVPPAGETDRFFRLASYTDGQPLLMRASRGRGQVFVFTSLPVSDWSNLGESAVLVPMMQRLLNAGAARLATAENAVCGDWRPASEDEIWTVVDGDGRRDPRWEAGVYRCGPRMVALNRPPAEDLPERVEEDRARALFGGVPVRIETDLAGRAAGRDENEIWPVLMVLCLLCLLGESILMLGFGTAKPAAAGGPAA